MINSNLHRSILLGCAISCAVLALIPLETSSKSPKALHAAQPMNGDAPGVPKTSCGAAAHESDGTTTCIDGPSRRLLRTDRRPAAPELARPHGRTALLHL